MLIKETIELMDDFFTSKPGERPFKAWLRVWRVQQRKLKVKGKHRVRVSRRLDIIALEDRTRVGLNRQIERFARRRDVKLLKASGE